MLSPNPIALKTPSETWRRPISASACDATENAYARPHIISTTENRQKMGQKTRRWRRRGWKNTGDIELEHPPGTLLIPPLGTCLIGVIPRICPHLHQQHGKILIFDGNFSSLFMTYFALFRAFRVLFWLQLISFNDIASIS